MKLAHKLIDATKSPDDWDIPGLLQEAALSVDVLDEAQRERDAFRIDRRGAWVFIGQLAEAMGLRPDEAGIQTAMLVLARKKFGGDPLALKCPNCDRPGRALSICECGEFLSVTLERAENGEGAAR